MPTIELLGGKVQIYQRGNSRFWQARASVGGKQRQFSTKQEGQDLAAINAKRIRKRNKPAPPPEED
jgi:hypothetical protein